MTRIKRSTKKWLGAGLLLMVAAGVSGCRTLGFYAQALRGQYEIFSHEKPITDLLQDTNTPAKLRQRLELLQQLRQFAQSDLKLPVNGHYRKYVDLHRPYVVWNVQAAPELSMEPKTWWYPLVGSLEYRGYFSYSGATNYAAYLRKKGCDVAVGSVQAYSTLGWFKDPVLNTFIFEPDAELAEIVFHELGHQRVFARGDTDFNEAFATTVGEEGARRWLKARGSPGALKDYVEGLHRNADFVRLVMETRGHLETIYGDTKDEEGKVKSTKRMREVPRAKLRAEKAQVYAQMKQDYLAMKSRWGGSTDYDSWFEHTVNNAHLNSVAAYFDLVPGFEALLALNGSDLEKFYDASARLAKMPKKERKQYLRNLASSSPEPIPTTAVSR